MKKICIGLLLCVGSLFATVYENAEDSSVNRWAVSTYPKLNSKSLETMALALLIQD